MALKKMLGLWDVFCLGAGVMISSGLFVLPGIAFGAAGPAVVLSYAIAAVMAIPAMLSQAELATAMPKAGGTYFFIERSLGTLAGLLAGLANWLGIALKSTFALIGIGAIAHAFWPSLSATVIREIAIALCVAFSILNILSVHGVKRFQVISVTFIVLVLGAFALTGFSSAAMTHTHFDDFRARGWNAIFATAGLVFISYGGLTKIASVAEEVRRPTRNIPLGMLLAIVVVSLLYVAVVFVTVGVLEPAQLYDRAKGPAEAASLIPLSAAAGKVLGRPGFVIMSVTALIALFTAANGGIFAASRNPMAMSRDGLLPEALQHVSRRFHCPVLSIALTCGFMVAVLALLDIKSLVKTASLMMLILFAGVNVAVLIMRASRVQNYRPAFRSPGFPYVQIVGIACYLTVIVTLAAHMITSDRTSTAPLYLTGAFVAAGVLWYGIYIRGRIKRESAFVYLVRSMVSRDLYRSGLDEELKQIALERDEVVHDRFDFVVRDCTVVDLPGRPSVQDMLAEAAERMAGKLDLDAQALRERLIAREEQSSTVIQPGIAVPHTIVPGWGHFQMLLVRCRQGIAFEGRDEGVHAAFVLAMSPDQRNLHLRALMAIAHIVAAGDFLQRWDQAADAEHLRDILLLSGRRRAH